MPPPDVALIAAHASCPYAMPPCHRAKRPCQNRQSGQSGTVRTPENHPSKTTENHPKLTQNSPTSPQNHPTSSNFLPLLDVRCHKRAHYNRYKLPKLTTPFAFPLPRSRTPPPFFAQKQHPLLRTSVSAPVKGPALAKPYPTALAQLAPCEPPPTPLD